MAATRALFPPIRGEVGIISAVLMTAVGGYIDAFLYLRHQVFGFAQTGNVVFLAVGVVKGEEWAKFAWPLLAYLAGLAVVVLAFLAGALCGAGVSQAIGPALWGAVILEALAVAVFLAQVRSRSEA